MQFPHFNPSKACHCPENKSTVLSTVCKSAQGCCSNLIFVPLPFAPLMELLPSLHSLSVLPLRAFVHALLLNTLPKIFTWLTSVHQGFCSDPTGSNTSLSRLPPHCSSPVCLSFGCHTRENRGSHLSFTLAPLIHSSEPSHHSLAHTPSLH